MNADDVGREQLITLLNIFQTRFSESGLRDFCFRAGIPFTNLPGDTHHDKARELIQYARRRNSLADLVTLGESLRDDITWPALAPSRAQATAFAYPLILLDPAHIGDNRIKKSLLRLQQRSDYHEGRGEVLPVSALFTELKQLFFKRNTFFEPLQYCPNSHWSERFCAAALTDQILQDCLPFLAEQQTAEQRSLTDFLTELQRQVHLYAEAMEKLFREQPRASQAERYCLEPGESLDHLEIPKEELCHCALEGENPVHEQGCALGECEAYRLEIQRLLEEAWPRILEGQEP